MSGASEIRRIETILKNRLAGGGQKNRLDRGTALRELALDIHQALANAATLGNATDAVTKSIDALESEHEL